MGSSLLSSVASGSWFYIAIPVCVALATCTAFGNRIARKLGLYSKGTTYFLLSRDSAWPKQPNPDRITDPSHQKRVIFIRHGESEWNLVFNKGFGPSFLVRLVLALWHEVLLLASPNSIFYDSGLSDEGVAQVKGLLTFLQGSSHGDAKDDVEYLNGTKGTSVCVTSNLRRCIQTAAIGLFARLQKSKEKIIVLNPLQEISRNVDCMALGQPKQLPPLDSRVAGALRVTNEQIYDMFNADAHTGNRALRSNGLVRMKAFNEWVFNRKEECVIAVGHSLYFRNYFRTFLGGEHTAKKKKMHNAAAVSFLLERADIDGVPAYRIAPDSIRVIYRGFE